MNLREPLHENEYSIDLTRFLLAAHIVVIKDVKLFQNGVSQEYSDLDIMQMIGRAVSYLHSALRVMP